MMKNWKKGQQFAPDTPVGYARLAGDIENKRELLRTKRKLEAEGNKVALVLYDDNGLADVILTK